MTHRVITILVADDELDQAALVQRWILHAALDYYRADHPDARIERGAVMAGARPLAQVIAITDPDGAIERMRSGRYDVAVFDYRWQGRKGFGLELLEACASGTVPVLTSQCQPISHSAASVFTPKSPGALRERIFPILRNPPSRGRIARHTGPIRALLGMKRAHHGV